MGLLIIPLVLASGAFFLNRSERNNEREIATDHQQEMVLQAYLDKMTELLLEKKLLQSQDETVKNVARIRTLTVLRGLDSIRKGLVLKFLFEAKLSVGNDPIIDLANAELYGVDVMDTYLPSINLENTYMQRANLIGAYLHGADLEVAHLEEADMTEAGLSSANLEVAYLQGANLKNANLSNATLRGAHLQGANLDGVYLKDTNLEGADVSSEQLAAAKSLQGAIMPDGTKHE
jgi:uncharacterized protein YjbI with pentapeptide repeats